MRRLFLVAALVGCAGYTGTARAISPSVLAEDSAWMWIKGVPVVLQESERDCGVAATSMVAGYWSDGHPAPLALRSVPVEGLPARQIASLLERQGLSAFVIEGQLADLDHELRHGRPVIVGLAKPHRDEVLYHYEVVVGTHATSGAMVTLDPANGWQQNTRAGFAAEWDAAGNVMIVAGRALPR